MTRPYTPVGNFNYPTPYRIGLGRLAELPDACREVGLDRPLVVTDPGIAGLPWFSTMLESLAAGRLEASVYSEVAGNPTDVHVRGGVEAYRGGGHDGIVAIGGGSALDVGKTIALMVEHPEPVFQFEDVGDNWKKIDGTKIPNVIAIPTTAGTGSEVGRASVIVDPGDHSKRIIFHPRMQPALVIADPELTIGLPPGLTAATGMDALAHCFEAYCAPGYHPMADGIALEGMRLIRDNLVTCVREGDNPVARTHMMMAASMGATAFQKGLGLVHALSHPLGGEIGVHHGLANAIFLPYVMIYNRAAIELPMRTLARHLDLPNPGFDAVLAWMLELREQLEIPHTLADVDGMTDALCVTLAPRALADPSLPTNPRSANLDDLEHLFRRALQGDLTP